MTPEDFAHNRSVIHQRIVAAGGQPDRVRLIAVSKGQPVESIAAAVAAGQIDFGENYAEELVAKAQEFASVTSGQSPVWHFQGRLQSNKINKLRPFVSWWHTLDSPERASALAQRVPGATVLIQIDSTDGLGDRSGVPLVEVPQLVHHARGCGLTVVGLMTVAPIPAPSQQNGADSALSEAAYRSFSGLATMADELELPERSMGMSGDLEVAVRAGTTIIRVGAALFGPRQ